jgi:hypothetical protein
MREGSERALATTASEARARQARANPRCLEAAGGGGLERAQQEPYNRAHQSDANAIVRSELLQEQVEQVLVCVFVS